MKKLTALAAALLLAAPAYAQAFKPFGAIVNGADCTVTLAFPEADFCSFKLRPEEVIGWYGHTREDQGGGNYIYTKETMHKVKFFDPGADKRFMVEFEIWSGRPEVRIPNNNLHLGN